MLLLLHIENIAVIQSADIQFDAGFNVLTGETGAGKSIVVDALNAVLGGRTSRDLIRTGAKSALVSAQFIDLPQLDWFQEQGHHPGRRGRPAAAAGAAGGREEHLPFERPSRVPGAAAGAGTAVAGHPRPARRAAAAGPGLSPGNTWTVLASAVRCWRTIRPPITGLPA